MATRIIHTDVQFTASTGIPRDDKHTTFTFVDELDQSNATLIAAVRGALESAWDLDGPGGADLASYMSLSVSHSTNGNKFRLYNVTGHLDGSPHGSPFAESPWTMGTAASNVALPDQIACVCTLRGLGWEFLPVESPDGPDAGTKVDRPRQRATGRMYIGPLNIDAQSHPVAGVSRPKPNFRTTVNQAIDELSNQLRAEGLQLVIWSRQSASWSDVVAAQVDDRWDTQRRRLPSPTVRETVDLTN